MKRFDRSLAENPIILGDRTSDRIEWLERERREAALDALAAMGQAQEAYEAQLKAEATLTAQVEALRGALLEIDALDPESRIGDCSVNAIRGLVLRMGQIARAALTTENHNG